MSNGSIQISNQSWGLTVLRVVTGIIFMAHGWQKLFQMGLHGTAGMFGAIGVPAPAVSSAIVTFVELLGGLALIVRVVVAIDAFDDLLSGDVEASGFPKRGSILHRPSDTCVFQNVSGHIL